MVADVLDETGEPATAWPPNSSSGASAGRPVEGPASIVALGVDVASWVVR